MKSKTNIKKIETAADKYTATIEIDKGLYRIRGLKNGKSDSSYRRTQDKVEVMKFVHEILAGV